MKEIVFDVEADGLLKSASTIYCLSYRVVNSAESGTLTEKSQIIEFFKQDAIFIGHYIIPFDFPLLKKIYGIEQPKHIIDTIGLSWYLHCQKIKHGLEEWGEEIGIPKPLITSWTELPLEDYIHRCEQDVRINETIYIEFKDYLNELYKGNYQHLINYLNFKLENLRDREEIGIDLDINLCLDTISKITPLLEGKFNKLSQVMPKKVLKKAPKILYKKDGSLSVVGERWQQELKLLGLSEDSDTIYTLGNPNSSVQLKEWLFSLGWTPITFKDNEKGEKVPQISLPFGQGLCSSITDMFDDYPFLEELDSLYMLRHRLGLLEGFIECVDEDWKVYSSASGFTNTLRWQHRKPICNLVGVDKPWGKEIRNCLKVKNNNFTMCGFDICALEDSTKQHYIYYYDPEYVQEMRVPGFDPHINLGVLGGLLTLEDEQFFKDVEAKKEELKTEFKFSSTEEEINYKRIKKIRGTAKTTNFAAVYGAGPQKISDTAKIPFKEAKELHTLYWQRNKAVKQASNSFQTKTVYRQLWVFNPISKFWIYAKNEKDLFSSVNQSKE